MEFKDRLKAVLKAYRDGAHMDLLDDLFPLLAEFVTKRVDQHVRQTERIASRDLEDLLVIVRDFKDTLEELSEKTGSQVIRIDELKQMEYKLTELLVARRI